MVYKRCVVVNQPAIVIRSDVEHWRHRLLWLEPHAKLCQEDLDSNRIRLLPSSFDEQNAIPLMLTSRLIHREVMPLVYSSNTFQFDDWAFFISFCRIGQRNLQHIRHIRLPLPQQWYSLSKLSTGAKSRPYDGAEELKELPGLECLALMVDHDLEYIDEFRKPRILVNLLQRYTVTLLPEEILDDQVEPVWSIVRPVRPQPYGRTGRANSLDGRTGCFIILGRTG